MKVAVVGCAHGELDKIYDTIACLEKKENVKVDLVLCCGDFQATRNPSDLGCMSVPNKYKAMGSFYKYYSGEKKAPILTIFIGGNHEASNYLQELEYGGWVAPNIYYLGYAGLVNFGGMRIGGLSGIYKPSDFMTGHHETVPYNDNTKRTVYHVRNVDVFRLSQLSGKIDAFLSHDWPSRIYEYGDKNNLLHLKPFLRRDIMNNQLGNPASSKLLHALKPRFWFSAHLHVKFAAVVPHYNDKKDDCNSHVSTCTRFLALDKCLPTRQFLQVVDIESENEKTELNLEYDLEWLTILYLTNHLATYKNIIQFMPGESSMRRSNFTPSEEEKHLVLARFNGNLKIPENFCLTAPIREYIRGNFNRQIGLPEMYTNPQTKRLCDILQLKDLTTDIRDVNVMAPTMGQESQDRSINRQSSNNTRGVDSSLNSSATEDIGNFSTFLANETLNNSRSSTVTSPSKTESDDTAIEDPVNSPNRMKSDNTTTHDSVPSPAKIKPDNTILEQSAHFPRKTESSMDTLDHSIHSSDKTGLSNANLDKPAQSPSGIEPNFTLLDRSLLSLPSPKFSAEMFLDVLDKPTPMLGKTKMDTEIRPPIYNSILISPISTSEIQAGSKETPKKACLEVHDKDALWQRFKRIDSVIQSAATAEAKQKRPDHGYKSWSRADMKYDRLSAIRTSPTNPQISNTPRSVYNSGNSTFQTSATAEGSGSTEAKLERTETVLQSSPSSKSSDLTHMDYSLSSVGYSPDSMFQIQGRNPYPQYTGRDFVLSSFSTMGYMRPDYGFPSSTSSDSGSTIRDSVSQNSSTSGVTPKRSNSVFDNFAVPSPRYKRMDSVNLPPTATDIRRMRANTVFPSITIQESQAVIDPRFARTESVIQGPISSSPKYTQSKTTTNSTGTPEGNLSVAESVIKSTTSLRESFIRRNLGFYSSEEK